MGAPRNEGDYSQLPGVVGQGEWLKPAREQREIGCESEMLPLRMVKLPREAGKWLQVFEDGAWSNLGSGERWGKVSLQQEISFKIPLKSHLTRTIL